MYGTDIPYRNYTPLVETLALSIRYMVHDRVANSLINNHFILVLEQKTDRTDGVICNVVSMNRKHNINCQLMYRRITLKLWFHSVFYYKEGQFEETWCY